MKVLEKNNFHIPLGQETYLALRRVAEETHQPATRLAREAIEQWLEVQRKNKAKQAIQNYAQENGGSDFDLNPELEEAGIEHLSREGKRGHGSR